ncbi:MAG: MBL fold metallo-hydrolase [Nanobdellota archaeon]
MRIRFHGAGRQVGRSCIELKSEESRILLDAGIWITEHGLEYPTEVKDLNKLDGVIISHAHLDHTGALPLFEHEGLTCPIFCNEETRKITEVLLKDSYKISRINHEHVAYQKKDIHKLNFICKEEGKINDISFSLKQNGHIPGSSSVIVEAEGKRLLYTGDINTRDSRLLKGSDTDFGDIDHMIVESTYGDRDHPDRKEQEEELKREVKETYKRGGKSLIAAFAVGRVQEMMILLKDMEIPIYVDGMGRQIADIFKDHPKGINDEFREALDKVNFISSKEDRDRIMEEPCIIITTSGMVNGGPILHYLKELYHDRKSSIILTGYQAENTIGRMISEEGRAFIDGNVQRLRMNQLHLDFSAHSGRKELQELIKKVNPDKLIVQHGDENAALSLKGWAEKEGIESVAPENGQEVEL